MQVSTKLYSKSNFLIFSSELVPATRFGAKPSHPNTFLNHQPGPNTPGFLSEAQRVNVPRAQLNLQSKVTFQEEDKLKKQAVIENKIRAKQSNLEKI